MASGMSEFDVLSQTRTYEPTPEGFDPMTASAEALRRHGLPGRPDPDREPELARLWKRVFARPVKFETAELAIDPAWRPRGRWQAEDQPFGLLQGDWGGVVCSMSPAGPYTQPATWVSGQWVVPWVSTETPGPDIQIGFWVGLDGAPWLDQTAAQQVLQAGIGAVVPPRGHGSAGVNWFAWTEWDTPRGNPPVVISNLPVAYGDTVCVLVCAWAPDVATAGIVNLSKGHGRTVGIATPPKTMSVGASAEWIVEGTSNILPEFDPVTFTNCVAGNSAGEIFDLIPGGQAINIVEPGPIYPGPQLTQTTIVSPQTAVVEELPAALSWLHLSPGLASGRCPGQPVMVTCAPSSSTSTSASPKQGCPQQPEKLSSSVGVVAQRIATLPRHRAFDPDGNLNASVNGFGDRQLQVQGRWRGFPERR